MEVLASAPRMERRGQRGLMVSLGRLADFRFGIPPETSCFHRIQADKTKAVLESSCPTDRGGVREHRFDRIRKKDEQTHGQDRGEGVLCEE